MAEKILNTRIQLKYDTLENWNNSTGILKAGEVAIATVPAGSTGQEVGSVATPQVLVKVGDGKNTFANLPYITAKAGDVYAWAKAEKLGKDAFSAEVQKLFTDIENDITALEGKVGDSKVADQITAAINALDVTDAAVANQFVVAVPQVDGKVAPVRRALEAADIPELAQSKITGLTTKLGDIDTEIEGIKTTATENLAAAKSYTDTKVKDLADGAVKTNTDAIAAINNETTGILATAKGYTDTEVGNAKTAAATDAKNKADQALVDAKAYVDEQIQAITGAETGSLSALEKRVAANEGAIEVIKGADTVEGSIAKALKDAKAYTDTEKTRATNAETALSGRLDTVEVFFESALKDSDGQQVIDTLKEIQDYIKSDQTGAADMLQSIQNNKNAIDVINGTAETEGSLAKVAADAAKAVADEKTRAEAAELANKNAAAAAKSAADAAQADVDALEGKVGAVPEDKTVVQMIADAQAAATYDDTEVRGLITANTTAISNEVTNRESAVNAVKTEIGVDAEGNYVALTGGHANLIAAINAANAGVATNAGNIQTNADAIAAINNETTGILKKAKDYTDAEIVKVNNTITALNGEVVKSVKGDDVVKASIANNELTIDFDDTLTFVFNCGTSAGLDAAAGV